MVVTYGQIPNLHDHWVTMYCKFPKHKRIVTCSVCLLEVAVPLASICIEAIASCYKTAAKLLATKAADKF